MDVDRLPGRRLPQLLEAIKAAGFAGANITYPFKQEIIPLLDAVDPEAAQVGAVNTVAIAPGWPHHRLQFRSPRLAQQFRGESRRGRSAGRDRGAGRRRRRRPRGRVCADGSRRRRSGAARSRQGARRRAARPMSPNTTARRAAVWPAILMRDIAAADGVVNATQIGMSGFPGNPVPCAALQAGALGRRRHLYADRDRIPQSRGRQRRARAERQRHVRASGGRSVQMPDRHEAGCGTAPSRFRQRPCRARRGDTRAEVTPANRRTKS